MKKLVFAFVLMLLSQSCSEKLELNTFANTKWVLSEWPGNTLPATQKATLNFTPDGNINGVSFCNNYGGKVSYDSNMFKTFDIFSTKIYCMDVADAENKFLADLKIVEATKMDAGKLVLQKENKVVMVFSPVK